MTAPLCIVVKGFPRVSETFITRELEALQDDGVAFSIASLRRPSGDAAKVSHRIATAPNYLPEYLHEEPMRVITGVMEARRLPGFQNAWRLFRNDVSRDWTRNRIRRFGQACVLAASLPEPVRHLHAHFIHTPASVARYAAAMRGLSYSVSAHAKDIWTTADWDLKDKLADARFVSVCNQAGAHRLTALAPEGKVRIWPHLVRASDAVSAEKRDPDTPMRLLTVARAVPKKGLATLVQALARLPPEPKWTWTHIGGGPLLGSIRAQVRDHPYRDRLNVLGAQPHDAVLKAMANHDIFALAALEADDGDRDGRPNALIEAMSAGLACVASPAGGIPELLSNGSGLLADANEIAFGKALAALLSDVAMVKSLGLAAQQRASQLRDEGVSSFRALVAALREASGQ